MKIKHSQVNWPKTYRLISTRFPPIDLFERVAPKEEWEDICNYEAAHNPRVRNTLFSNEESLHGIGSSFVMAPFYYNLPAGRFTTSDFGGYYAANKEITAIYEKAHHVSIFYNDSREEAGIVETYLMLVGKINAELCDLTNLPMKNGVYAINSYEKSRELASKLFSQDENGIVYNSVRHLGGACFVAYKPKIVSIPVQGIKPVLHWDGTKIDKWHDGKNWNIL